MSDNIYDSRRTESPFESAEKRRTFEEHPSIKAYENQEFLTSGDGRVIRIMSEYLEPESRLRHYRVKDTVVFYGSARFVSEEEAKEKLERAEKNIQEYPESDEFKSELKQAQLQMKTAEYYEAARQLAERLTRWSLGELEEDSRFIVCSGGGPGIMEAANRGAAEAGGPSVGMNISLPFEQFPNRFISPNLSFEFHYFFMRKFWFVYLAKALVIFPGGFGTFDELFDLLTLLQTGKIKKPMTVVIYGSEFWNSVVNFDKLIEMGVIVAEDLDLFKMVDTVDDAYNHLIATFEREFVGKPGYWQL